VEETMRMERGEKVDGGGKGGRDARGRSWKRVGSICSRDEYRD